MEKEFKTIKEQIEILRSRGMDIPNDSFAERALLYDNYYNIINGYKDPFLSKESTPENEIYIKNTNFAEVYVLYNLDSDLRMEFIQMTLIMENHIKSVLAYEFSAAYGHKDYLNRKNFDIFKKDGSVDSRKVRFVDDLIEQIWHDIDYQYRKNNPMVVHYRDDIGYIPMWVLVNILTLGTVAKFYSALKDRDKNNISRNFCLFPKQFRQILSVLTLFRNHAAHNGIIYNYRCRDGKGNANRIPDLEIHDKLSIPQNLHNVYAYGKNDLFAIVIIFKALDHSPKFKFFCDRIESLLSLIDKSLITLSSDDIRRYMGFPDNWFEIKGM